MNITDLIVEFIKEGNVVEFPGMGTLTSSTVSAHHDAASGTYYPARRTVVMNNTQSGNQAIIRKIAESECVTVEIAEMVLNRVNKTLVKMIEQLGVHSIGISGKDGGMLHVHKKLSKGEDIGLVGEIDNVNPKILNDLISNDYLPVVCPVGYDDNYDTYNINADDAACAIAKAMKVEKLAFLSDVPGVLRDPSDPSSLIYELPYDELTTLIESGAITGGMLPKLKSCKDAIDNGVSRVHIMDGRIPHCVLLEIFTNQGIGTAIMSKNGERYFKG